MKAIVRYGLITALNKLQSCFYIDTAYCRHPYNADKFLKFDDKKVCEIGSNEVQVSIFNFSVANPANFIYLLSQTAAGYVLFYTSIDFVPPNLKHDT